MLLARYSRLGSSKGGTYYLSTLFDNTDRFFLAWIIHENL